MKLGMNLFTIWVLGVLFCVFLLAAALTSYADPVVNERILIESLSFVPGASILAGMGIYSPQDRVLVKGVSVPATAGGIYFWSTDAGKLEQAALFPKHEWPEQFSISADGTRAGVIFFEGGSKKKDNNFRPYGLGCYSLTNNKWLWKWKWRKDEKENPELVRFLPDSRRILVVGYFSVSYYDPETGQRVKEWKRLLKDYTLWTHALRTIHVSPSCRLLVIWQEKPWEGIALGGVNKYVTVWDLETGKEISRWEKPSYECRIATFTPDEQSVVFGCQDGYVREWSIKDQSIVKELKMPGRILSVAFSPDGRFLAVNADIKNVTVFDYEKRKEIHQFDSPGKNYSLTGGHQYPMAFSSDGEYFALWDRGRVCLYATSTWEQKWCVIPKPPNMLNK